MKLEVARTPDCASWMEQLRHNVARGDTHAQLFRQGVLQVMKWYDSAWNAKPKASSQGVRPVRAF